MLGSLLVLGRAKVHVELATRYARHASPIRIWPHNRELQNKIMVLLPLRCHYQQGVRFHPSVSILTVKFSRVDSYMLRWNTTRSLKS